LPPPSPLTPLHTPHPRAAECFDEYQCQFHRFPSETGLQNEYSWDIFNLCASAGNEYIAALDPRCLAANGTCLCNSCDTNARLRFNVCGTVSGPIAPVAESAGTLGVGDPQQLPIPHSHGVAVQYIEGYPGPTLPDGYGPAGGCADIDTCDQQYNPTCLPYSQNYPAGQNPGDPLYTRRANTCATQGDDYCSPYSYWCCSVKPTPCTKAAEVLAYYDGSPPNFNLFNEGSPDGLTLSYYGALPYLNDPFPCSGSGLVDPSTGFAPTRAVTIVLRCNLTADTLTGITYLETFPCNCAWRRAQARARAHATMRSPPPRLTTCTRTRPPHTLAPPPTPRPRPSRRHYHGLLQVRLRHHWRGAVCLALPHSLCHAHGHAHALAHALPHAPALGGCGGRQRQGRLCGGSGQRGLGGGRLFWRPGRGRPGRRALYNVARGHADGRREQGHVRGEDAAHADAQDWRQQRGCVQLCMRGECVCAPIGSV
jgi:hypothetical protein